MRNLFYLFILLLILSGCGLITIVTGQWEKPEKFKVELTDRPSKFISEFTGNSIYLTRKNYFITFFDIYCGFSYKQIYACNKLYQDNRNSFEFVAITIYDSLAEIKYRQRMDIGDSLHYSYRMFYNVNGLKSSLRNLYYENSIPKKDIVPMNIIIVNDTIKRIYRGAINTKQKYYELKYYMDSLSESMKNKNNF